MADQDQTTIRKIDWKSVFPFMHLFRGFRLAIDPSKLVLALAAILLLYIGGRLMDSIWPTHSRAMNDEIQRYESYSSGRNPLGGDTRRPGIGAFSLSETPVSDFHATRKTAAQERYDGMKSALRSVDKPVDGDTDDLIWAVKVKRDQIITEANEEYAKLPSDQKTDAAKEVRDNKIESAYAFYAAGVNETKRFCGEGLFIHFIEYQINQIDNAAAAAVALDFTGPVGVLSSLQRFFVVAPKWAITQHYVYFTVFFAFYVLVMAIAGGAISRISAVQVARDEKISVRQALRFSTGKVLSFIFAPLIPIIIIAVIALVLGLLSFAMSVDFIGLGGLWSIIVGALFILALIAGLVMTLTALGLAGGGHLMYPTIAVEGSDSFDAVSRSFSYLYARPWQLIFYSAVALVYGAITYLFVRYFIYLVLYLTHCGVGMFMWGDARNGADLMNTIWPSPTSSMNLTYNVNFPALGVGHSAGAFLIATWVYLAIAMLGAFAISLYFSLSTIIYYLLRKEVDATAIDEVYLEPNDEDFAEPVNEPVSETAPIPAPVDAPADPVADAPVANDPPASDQPTGEQRSGDQPQNG